MKIEENTGRDIAKLKTQLKRLKYNEAVIDEEYRISNLYTMLD